jgi:hypothetical protein
MLQAGDVLDLGPLNTKFTIVKTAADTGGRSFEMEWELGPQTGGTPVHIHPQAVETYEVLQGELDVYIDGTWKTLRAVRNWQSRRGYRTPFATPRTRWRGCTTPTSRRCSLERTSAV